MKNSLVVGNTSIGLVALRSLENLEEAKETITLINNEMEYHIIDYSIDWFMSK
jgi:hypothetical protein